MAQRPLPLASRAGVRGACAGACLLLALLAGCGGGFSSGVHGTVTLSPTTPVCRAGIPCWKSAGGVPLNFMRNDGFWVSADAAANGTYFVSLPPGVYTVTLPTNAATGAHAKEWYLLGGIEPRTVHVVAWRNRRVDFRIDTGLR